MLCKLFLSITRKIVEHPRIMNLRKKIVSRRGGAWFNSSCQLGSRNRDELFKRLKKYLKTMTKKSMIFVLKWWQSVQILFIGHIISLLLFGYLIPFIITYVSPRLFYWQIKNAHNEDTRRADEIEKNKKRKM